MNKSYLKFLQSQSVSKPSNNKNTQDKYRNNLTYTKRNGSQQQNKASQQSDRHQRNDKQIKRVLFETDQSFMEDQHQKIIAQLQYSSLLIMCKKFETRLIQIMQQIFQKVLTLQFKIARCQNHFNAIELQLAKKCRQIKLLTEQNKTLISANLEIQQSLAQLQHKYSINRQKDKNQGIQSALLKLSQNLDNKYAISQSQDQNRKKISQQLHRLEQCLHNNRQTQNKQIILPGLKKMLQELFFILYSNHQQKYKEINEGYKINASISEYAHSKILQNIDLKFKLMNLEINKINIAEIPHN